MRENACDSPLETALDDAAVIPPVREQKCSGSTCLLCDGDTLDIIPDGAHVYITPKCAPFIDILPPQTITLTTTARTIQTSLNLYLQAGDTLTLVGPPLSVAGPVTITGANSTVIFSTSTVECHLIVDKGGVSVESLVLIENGRCGIALYSDTPSVALSADLLLSGGLEFSNCTENCFAAAVSNLQSTITIVDPSTTTPDPPTLTVLVIETSSAQERVTVASPHLKTLSVSNLLNVFGTDYEIEYACEASGGTDCSPEISARQSANAYLVPIAGVFIVLYLTNPSFGYVN
jgi:hypothetical protein